MANLLNLARMTVASAPGTASPVTLGAVVAGFLTFAQAGAVNARLYRYAIREGNNREICSGIYTASGTTLTRVTLASTNGGSPCDFTAAAIVSSVVAAEDIIQLNSDQSFTQPQQSVLLKQFGAVGGVLKNGKIVESHAGNAQTYALKGLDGNDPSPTNPVGVCFNDGSIIWQTAALSIAIGSATLGVFAGFAFAIWVAMANNAGTLKFVVRNCFGTGIAGFPGNGIISAVNPPANLYHTNYSDATITAKPFVVVARVEYLGLTTPGTWNVTPIIRQFVPGMKLPCDVNQIVQVTASQFSTTSATYQNTNLTTPITLDSPMNFVRVSMTGWIQLGGATGTYMFCRWYRGGASGVGIGSQSVFNTGAIVPVHNSVIDAPNSVGPLTYTWCIFSSDGATLVYTGTLDYMTAEEIVT